MSTSQHQIDYRTLEQELAGAREENARLKSEVAMTQQRFLNVFENAGDSIFIIDVDTRTILDANTDAARRLGYKLDELIGMSMYDIEVLETEKDDESVTWESTFGRTRFYECNYRHRHGHLVPVEVSSRRVLQAGRLVIQNFVRNITVRREMEMERQQLISDLDNFAHTVAHDLKNPLSLIISYISVLRENADSLSNKESNKCLQAIFKNAYRSVKIVDALLLFASVNQQEYVEYSVLDMKAIVQDVQEHLAELFEQHHAKIILPDSWPVAVGYAPWVGEVWINYLSNAIKYGDTPPQITLWGEVEPGGFARFYVQDNGPGIAPEYQSCLFNQFNRLADVDVEGHGLGLSIVKRIVNRLGGEVAVESDVGQGSTFSFTLPAPSW